MIISPEVENISWAMLMSTTVSCPKASWDTQARKCRTMNSYTRPSLPWTQKKQKIVTSHCLYSFPNPCVWICTKYNHLFKCVYVWVWGPTCNVLLYLVGCIGGWAWSDFLPCRGLGPPGCSSTRCANVPQSGLCVCCSTRGPRARFSGKMFVSVRG